MDNSIAHQIRALTEQVNSIDTAVVGAVLQKHSTPLYHCTDGHLKALLGLDGGAGEPLDIILRKLNTYIWNNQLTCGRDHLKLTPALQEAVHLYEQSTSYSVLLMAFVKHFRLA